MSNESVSFSRNTGEQFQKYIDDTLKECAALSMDQKRQELEALWTDPKIVEYYESLPEDDPTKYLAESLRELVPSLEKKILCVGGATGRLGRYISTLYPSSSVVEVDMSYEMTAKANQLAREGGQTNFSAIVADARALPFVNGEYDYVLAHGLFRYLGLEDQQTVASEMLRVAKYGFTVSEGKARDLIYTLRDSIDPELSVRETKMPMLRMTLFFMLLRKYGNDNNFRALVEKSNKNNPIEFLSKLAGTSEGVLYELRIKAKNK